MFWFHDAMSCHLLPFTLARHKMVFQCYQSLSRQVVSCLCSRPRVGQGMDKAVRLIITHATKSDFNSKPLANDDWAYKRKMAERKGAFSVCGWGRGNFPKMTPYISSRPINGPAASGCGQRVSSPNRLNKLIDLVKK